MNWKTPVSFGQYKGYPLIAVLVAGKAYLRWCYENEMDKKYPELAWLRDNVNAKEWGLILNAKD